MLQTRLSHDIHSMNLCQGFVVMMLCFRQDMTSMRWSVIDRYRAWKNHSAMYCPRERGRSVRRIERPDCGTEDEWGESSCLARI